MNADFDHALETLELIEEAAAIASNNVAHNKAGGYKPNLEWYAARFQELQGLVRGLSCELWSLALKYDQPQQRKESNVHNDAEAAHAR